MTTRADVLSAVSAGRRAGGREAATAFARLLGLAFVISVVLGLLLTAAAVALPAPIVGSEVPAQVEGADRPAGALPLDALLALAALVLGGLAWTSGNVECDVPANIDSAAPKAREIPKLPPPAPKKPSALIPIEACPCRVPHCGIPTVWRRYGHGMITPTAVHPPQAARGAGGSPCRQAVPTARPPSPQWPRQRPGVRRGDPRRRVLKARGRAPQPARTGTDLDG